MLILGRHRNESIMIGEDIEIIVIDIRRDKVRFGIIAPRYVPIHRMEVYEAIQREKLTKDKNNVFTLDIR